METLLIIVGVIVAAVLLIAVGFILAVIAIVHYLSGDFWNDLTG